MFERLIKELGGMEKFVKPGQTVLVKPNIAWNQPPEMAANTNPELVAAIIRHCIKAGASKVYVFDTDCDGIYYENAFCGIKCYIAYVAAEIEDTYWVEIDYEQLLTWNPAYIILASDATYTVDDVLADPNLATCAAVVNGNVYQLPNKAEAWDSPVPSGILGALWLANILHGDLLSDDDCAAKMDEYYETFYNFTYSEN